MYKLQTQIKGIQINLQHSRLATETLRRIIEDSTGILCIQQTYTIQNKIAGLSNATTFSHREEEVIVQLQ